jgi:hypothetical protein
MATLISMILLFFCPNSCLGITAQKTPFLNLIFGVKTLQVEDGRDVVDEEETDE